MAVVGTVTESRKWRWVLYMVASVVFSAWAFYDGWFNPKYQIKDELSNRLFNQVGSIVLAVMFVVLVIRFFTNVLKTRVTVDETGIDVCGKIKIAWSAMVRIDDKNLEKGLLDIFYNDSSNTECKYTLDNYKVTNFEEMVEVIATHRKDLLPLETVEESGEGK